MKWVWTKVTVVLVKYWQENHEFHAGFGVQSQVSDTLESVLIDQ